MWPLTDTAALATDLYELTMAQIYFHKQMTGQAYFEVTIRRLPQHWGFFVMAGLEELDHYLRQFHFGPSELQYLRSTGLFDEDFLQFLAQLKADVTVRALPEGTVFFPHEPILELSGPLAAAQILESYVLNILGFSIIEATVAARLVLAAKGIPVVDFGLRRAQGPVAALRSARGAQLAGFAATSNLHAAKYLQFAPAGTMAHSFVQSHQTEQQAFESFVEQYAHNAVLLVDTYDSIEGIKLAAQVAKQAMETTGTRIKGIRIDSGDLVELSRFARRYFRQQGLEFLKIFVSGDLDEFKIADLLDRGAEIDGFGVGTNFAVSRSAPAVEIVYKMVQYGDKPVFKTSHNKKTLPGRKSIIRKAAEHFEKDIVLPRGETADDLLQPFHSPEPMPTIQQRLTAQLSALPATVKAIRDPEPYPVEFSLPTAGA